MAGRASRYTTAELARLLGVSNRRVGASLRRLAAAGLLVWSEIAITFAEPPLPSQHDLGDTIGRGRGVLALPRRILRILVGGARPALIATTLGILLRCLSRRRHGFDGRGRIKASWIATTFRVDLRRVKAARQELIALGWIATEPDDQVAMNRWGRAYRIDLAWRRPDGTERRPLPPPPAAEGPKSPPPSVDQDPFQEEIKNQEPARGGPAGVDVGREGTPSRPAPKLDDVRPEDLRQTDRTLVLFDQAVERGLIGPSESDRLKFVAAAEHARVVGTRNPCGLFARLVRRGWWHFATQEDEDSAAGRLRSHRRGKAMTTERSRGRASTFVADVAEPSPLSLANLLASSRDRVSTFVADVAEPSPVSLANLLGRLTIDRGQV